MPSSNEKSHPSGPAPSRKAQIALGPKLNCKPKEPPTFPGKTVPDNRPATRRKSAEQ